VGDQREITGEHRRTSNARGRHVRRFRDRVDEHAFERALPQLAEQQADEEVLLAANRARRQLSKQIGARACGSTSGRGGKLRERLIDVAHVERGFIRGRDVAQGHHLRVADAHSSLSGFTAQERDDNRDLFARCSREQIAQMADFLEPSRRRGHGIGRVNDVREAHVTMVAKGT